LKLLVDIGNSRIKWALSDARPREVGACDYRPAGLAATLERAWQALQPPQAVLVANVAGPAAAVALDRWTTRAWKLRPNFVISQRRFAGVVNAYPDKEQLGVDRWLALVAAWNKYATACCVVDCGTALTVDVLDDRGRHRGGVILPGSRLMRRALADAAAQLPAAGTEPEEEDAMALALGSTTAEGLRYGAHYAVIGAVSRILQDAARLCGSSLRLLVGGGDGARVLAALDRRGSYEPDLVLEGLALHATQRR